MTNLVMCNTKQICISSNCCKSLKLGGFEGPLRVRLKLTQHQMMNVDTHFNDKLQGNETGRQLQMLKT